MNLFIWNKILQSSVNLKTETNNISNIYDNLINSTTTNSNVYNTLSTTQKLSPIPSTKYEIHN